MCTFYNLFQLVNEQNEKRLKERFDFVDKNGDGLLSRDEVHTFNTAVGLGDWTDSMFKKDDGSISFEEYVSATRKTASQG